MPDITFGGTSVTSFTDQFVATDGVPRPTGRVCSDGVSRAGITHLGAWLNGNGAGRNFNIQWGGTITGTYTSGTGAPGFSSYIPVTAMGIVSGGVATFRCNFSGMMNFLRGANGTGASYDAYSNPAWTGPLGGACRYAQPPTAPTLVSVTPSADGTSATVVSSITGVDNGGATLGGRAYQRATNAAFTTGLTTIGSTANSVVFTGLTPGVTYYYHVCVGNAVTAGVLGGAWSSTVSAAQPFPPGGLGRRASGGTFVSSEGKRWSGSVWQELDGKRWSGSAWVDIGD